VCREIGDLLVLLRPGERARRDQTGAATGVDLSYTQPVLTAPAVAARSRRLQIRYIVSAVSTSSLEPDDVRAAAELHREIDPEYRDAVVESFLDRVGKEIDARVDRRLAAQPAPQPRTMALAIVSVALGIPLTGMIMSLSQSGQLAELAVVWVMIAVINVAYALGHRLPPPRR
jgi:hypothetical protein